MTRRILLACLLLLACGLGFTVWFVLEGGSEGAPVARELGPQSSTAERAPGPEPELVDPGAAHPGTLGAGQVAAPSPESRAPVAAFQSPALMVLVQDEQGAPIAGAEVLRMIKPAEGQPHAPDDEQPVFTNEQGRCALPPSGANALHVRAHGFYHRKLKPSAGSPTTVVMSPAARVTGRVLEAESLLPIARAKVRPRSIGCSVCPPRVAVTGALGEFTIEGFPLHQQVGLRASAEGFLTGKAQFEVRDQSATSLDLVLQRGAEIWLEFFDLESGDPVSSVRVKGAKQRTTDAFGLLRSKDLVPAGETDALLKTEREGYLVAYVRLGPEHLNPTRALRVPLARAQQFAGQVRDPSGNPIHGATVKVEERTQDDAELAWRRAHQTAIEEGPRRLRWKDLRSSESRTDAEGQFLLPGLAPWTREIEFRISHDDFIERSERRQIDGETLPFQTNWILTPVPDLTGTIRGRLSLSLNGEPTAGAVFWSGAHREGGEFTDPEDDGSFLLPDVESGSVTLSAYPAALLESTALCGDEDEYLWTVEVRANETTTVDLNFDVSITSLSGYVRFPDGEPAAGLHFSVSDDRDCGEGWGSTNELGAWSVAVLTQPANWTVEVRSPFEVHTQNGIQPGASDVDFVIQRTARTRLRVLDGSTGLPLTKFDLLWQRPGDTESAELGQNLLGLPDPSGWFDAQLPRGRIDLAVSLPRKRTQLQPAVALGIDTTTGRDLEFTLRPGHRLDLELAKGVEPWPRDVEIYLLADHERGALIWDEAQRKVRDGDISLGRTARSQRRVKFSGRKAHVSRLPPGRYRFVSYPNSVLVQPASVLAGPGTEVVRVRWERR